MIFIVRGKQVAEGERTRLLPIGECIAPNGDRKLLMARNETHVLVRDWPDRVFGENLTESFKVEDVNVLWEE